VRLEAREILEVPSARLAAERAGCDALGAPPKSIKREKAARGGRGSRFEVHRNFQ